MRKNDLWRSLRRGSQVAAVSDVRLVGSAGLRRFPWLRPATTPATLQENSTFRTKHKNPSNNLVVSTMVLRALVAFASRASRGAAAARSRQKTRRLSDYLLYYSFYKGKRPRALHPRGCAAEGLSAFALTGGALRQQKGRPLKKGGPKLCWSQPASSNLGGATRSRWALWSAKKRKDKGKGSDSTLSTALGRPAQAHCDARRLEEGRLEGTPA